MIRPPIGLRIEADPETTLREQLRLASSWGAKGVVLDAAGDLAPHRLSQTGRSELKSLLRASELTLIALHLPTRRPFDSDEDLDDRLTRAERAFALAYDLGSRMTLLHAGPVPADEKDARRAVLRHALFELATRADRRGVRVAIEAGHEPADGLCRLLDDLAHPMLAASIDPGAFSAAGLDPAQSVRILGRYVAHAYANQDPGGGDRSRARPASRFGRLATPSVSLDWEAYLGALEEVDYRGYLTIWPDPAADAGAQFREIMEILQRF